MRQATRGTIASVRSLALLSPLLLAACHPATRAHDAPGPVHVRVRTADVERARLAPPIRASGLVVDEAERALSFLTPGVLARVHVDEGDAVRRGQVLASLELDVVDADLAAARAALERAERDRSRARTLAESGALPSQALEDASTAEAISRARARAAGYARRRAVLVAPADGHVLARRAEPGETVGAGAPVLVLSLTDGGRIVRLHLTDREIVRVNEGDAAEVSLDAFPDRRLAARVARIARAADPGSGLHFVELAVDGLEDLGARVTAGLVARATLHPSDAREVGLIPTSALVEANGREGFVWTVPAGARTAERRTVAIAFLEPDRVAIASGLDDVATVVSEGAAYVRRGTVLDVVPPTVGRAAP